MSFRAPALLAVLLAAVAPGAARAQRARVGAVAGPGGTVVGRVCVDADRDGACGDAEPGIAGARVRFEDGRSAVADAGGRFHAVDVAARLQLPDRDAYGAHAVTAEGLGVTSRFELGARGAASVDLPVAPPLFDDGAGGFSASAGAPPALEPDRVQWPIVGTGPAGARVEVGGVRVEVGADGRWSTVLALRDGANPIGAVIVAPDGAVSIWRLGHHVARPAGGAVRVYVSRPIRIATLTIRPAGQGAVLVGRVEAGVALGVGGLPIAAAPDGWFGAWVPSVDGAIAFRAVHGGALLELTLPSEGDGAFRGVLLGELGIQAGGEAGFLATGRLAGSTRGRWRGFQVDAGVDLDDRDRRALDLLAPRDALTAGLAPDPLRAFAVAGDGAAVEDANPGRGRLWARVEGHGLKLGLGSGRTGAGEGELGRHDRSFFGGRVEVESTLGPARLGALLYGGRSGGDAAGLAPGVPCQDLLAATGGSVFYLSHRQLVAGSEIVRAEWRDPLTRVPVRTRELVPGRDYELDALGGRLLLARPLATLEPLAATVPGEPFAAAEVWLVVDYLRGDAGDGDRALGGGELRAAAGPVALALGGASELRPGEDWGLVRGAASIDLGAALQGRLELARSRGQPFDPAGGGRGASLDGGFTFAAPVVAPADGALAFHAELHGEAGPASWRAWWRERPRGYSDGSYSEASDALERGAMVQGGAGPLEARLVWAERSGADARDPSGLARREASRAVASAAWSGGPFRLSVEALHERIALPAAGSQAAAGLRAEWRASPGITLEAGHLQAFGASGEVVDATFSSAGASLRTSGGTLALRAGWGPELGPRLLLSGDRSGGGEGLYGTLSAGAATAGGVGDAGSAVGGRQRVGGATLFTEERVVRDPRGLVAGRVVGAALEPRDGLRVALSAERGERLWMDGRTTARSAGGLSLAWTPGAIRVDGRAELRAEGSGRQWMAGAGVEWPLLERLTLALRAALADGEIAGLKARTGEGWLSAAWRSDALSVLGRLGRVLDDREGILERDATVAAVAMSARLPGRRARLALGLDVADQRVGGAGDDRAVGSVRAEYGLFGPVDLAVEYARRGSLEGRELGDLDALRLEAGFTASEVRLSLGYTLAGFQGDGIEPEGEDGRFYLRAVLVR